MRSTKKHATIPIGRTARIAYELDSMRADCSAAAVVLLSKDTVDDAEVEDCARLDDAVAEAQRVLKSAIRKIMLSRLSRHSRAR